MVEIMLCAQGCIAGGGQPKLASRRLIPNRKEGLQLYDSTTKVRSLQENTQMLEYMDSVLPEGE